MKTTTSPLPLRALYKTDKFLSKPLKGNCAFKYIFNYISSLRDFLIYCWFHCLQPSACDTAATSLHQPLVSDSRCDIIAVQRGPACSKESGHGESGLRGSSSPGSCLADLVRDHGKPYITFDSPVHLVVKWGNYKG